MIESDEVWSGHIRLNLLRDFKLTYNGELVEVAPCAQRLISFLALQTDQRARRTYVSGRLWARSKEAHAHASLRSALWRSPVCGRVPVVRANTTHLWLGDEVEIDLSSATVRARQLLNARSVDLLSIDVTAELSSFASDVLVGWYDEWVDVEREQFRQMRLHVLDRMGELLLQSRRYAEAVHAGLLAISSDHLRESAHRLLIRAHLSEGNRAEALRQYRSYSALLAEELGVAPSAAMDQLITAAVPNWEVSRRSTG